MNGASGDTLGIYVHIPYCLRKCAYCGFLSHPIDEHAADYAAFVAQEAALRAEEAVAPCDTLFLGGGTPSLLPGDDIAAIIEAARRRLRLTPDAEITMEINPETVTAEKAEAWARAGINRASVGAQSFNAQLLAMLGRGHDQHAPRRAITLLRAAGMKRLSLDLMYGLPEQRLGDWKQTLDEALSCGVSHLSCYALSLEEATPLWREVKTGKLTLLDEDTVADQLEYAVAKLEAEGYTRYEISNFARESEQCRHNLHYWRMDGWIALGCGAHGQHSGGVHYENHADETAWRCDIMHGQKPECQSLDEGLDGLCMDAVMMGLRLAEGIDCRAILRKTGMDVAMLYEKGIEKAIKRGLLWRRQSRLGPTPLGMNLQNTLLLEVLGDVL